MQWQDTGMVLATRPFGESKMIVHIFGQTQGHCTGLIRRCRKGVLPQPGSLTTATWTSRTESGLGYFTLEPTTPCPLPPHHPHAVYLASICAILLAVLPERHAYPRLYTQTLATAQACPDRDPIAPYIAWEILLLQELGYGLQLHQCAVCGTRDGLSHVSPKSGRAVCHQHAAPWISKLLALPACLYPPASGQHSDLHFSGFFVERWLFGTGKTLPCSRKILNAPYDAASNSD